MKTHLKNLILLLALLACLAQAAHAAVTFSVTPAAVSNTWNGNITLQISGLTNTETVVVQKFLDINNNGVIDGGDWLAQQFTLTDGQAGMVIGGVTNINVPGDTDGTANGQITAKLNFQNGDFIQNICGRYLYKLSSPVGHFGPMTNSFSVTNFSFPQKITGNVVSNNTSTTVPNAVVILFQPPRAGDSGPGIPQGGIIANNAGSYSINMPPGTYWPMVLSSNFVYDYAATPSLTLAGSQTINTNLALIPATSTISGTVWDSSTGIKLPGLGVFAEYGGTPNVLIAFTCADTNGNFTLPVTPAGSWGLGAEPYQAIGFHGCVGWYNDPIYSAYAGATGVNLDYPQATSLYYGTVKDNLGNPLPGIAVSASDNNEVYDMDGNSDVNGNYVVGALGSVNNPWFVNIDFSLSPANYLFSGQTNFNDLNAGQPQPQNFTAIPATNFITGSLKDNYGNPIAGVEIYDYDETPVNGIYYQGIDEAITDINGNYSLNVANGTWQVAVDTSGDNTSLPNNYTDLSPAYTNVTILNTNAVVYFTAMLKPLSGYNVLNVGTIGEFYSGQLFATGGKPPYSWSLIFGSLPPSLTLATNGVISGTPTNIGSFDFTVKVTDALSETATSMLVLTVESVQVTTIALSNGTNGLAYSQQLSVANGELPYTWSLISGSLPSNLTLGTNGLISGIPTNSGVFNFIVKVTDALSETATQALDLTIFGPPSVTLQPTNNSVTVTVGSNVTLAVSASGTGPFTYQWQLNGTNLPKGIITTVAGDGINGYAGDGGVATNAELAYPLGLAVDAKGDLFIADSANSRVRKVGVIGTITTVAGNGTQGYSGDGGAATNAELFNPAGVAVDAKGDQFIADTDNERIREVGTNGIITTVANELNGPAGVAVDATGNLFIADELNQCILEMGTNGIITTVAGDGSYGYYGDGGAAIYAELDYPSGVAVDATGNLFIADQENDRIRKVGTNGIITTVAGNGFEADEGYGGYSGDGGAATNAELWFPYDVAVDATGNLFIADTYNKRIREVGTNGIITTVAGGGTNYPGDWGAATNAELGDPLGLAVDATGNLFIADYYNMVIREVMFNSSVLSPTLILNNVNFGNAGAYDVVVSNPYGSVTSSVVNLTITLAPVILSTPQISVSKTNFTFLLSGPVGSNYVLQVSTNLLNWNPVSTSTIPVSGSITLSNAISGYKQGFFRVHLQ